MLFIGGDSMKDGSVAYIRENGTSNVITVKGENKSITSQNAKTWLVDNESAVCVVQIITEKKV